MSVLAAHTKSDRDRVKFDRQNAKKNNQKDCVSGPQVNSAIARQLSLAIL